ncbi:hypothetical protein sos41_32580 [Alphaproteobacteria bacterium SO-S41]|nr:hypothetical protein sos41_32580 [Alphaproteobacteria bacterium SO-S41]
MLGACGRKGPLDPPGGASQEAPAGTPNPEPKPDEAKPAGAKISPRVAPEPQAKPEAVKPTP